MLLDEIWNAENMISLHGLCDAIGILDCLASFASYVAKRLVGAFHLLFHTTLFSVQLPRSILFPVPICPAKQHL